MQIRLGRVWFDPTGARITIVGVLVGFVLALVVAVVGHHFWRWRHTMDLNPQDQGQLIIGFVTLPSDMARSKSLVSAEASYEQSGLWRFESLVQAIHQPDRVVVKIVYWNINDEQVAWRHEYFFARDPSRNYLPVWKVREVELCVKNDSGEVIVMISIPVVITPPAADFYTAPRPKPSPSSSPSGSPRGSGNV